MRLGILCPGQGDQTPSMFHVLAGLSEAERVIEMAAVQLGEDPRLIHADRLPVNAIAQPILCALQLATWEALRHRLPEPCVFAGYSVGELAAHGCAGALAPDVVIALAGLRAALMDAASPVPGGLMAVRGLLRPELESLCAAHSCEIAIVNEMDRLVVGGPRDRLAALALVLEDRSAKVTPLKITVASHTSAMESAVAPFRKALAGAPWGRHSSPVLAGIDGGPVQDGGKATETLARQVAQPVDWLASMNGLSEMGCDVLLELGPCNGLARMVRDRFPNLPVRSVSEFRSLDGVVDWVEAQS